MLEKYLNSLNWGLNFNDILFFLILILFICHIISKIRIRKKISKIPGVQLNESIETEISKIKEEISKIINEDKKNKEVLENLHKKTEKISKIYTKKYNPYQDAGVGGLQSFSTAFLDEYGDGIILTSLYSRERSRVSLKEIKKFQSEQKLTPEEIEVLEFFKK